MVGCGFFFIAIAVYASWLRWRGTLFQKRWLLWVFVSAVLPAVAANQAGWIAAEVGRQPWIVHPPVARDAAGEPVRDADGFVAYATAPVPLPDGSTVSMPAGLLTTDGGSVVVTSEQVASSIAMFGAIYLLLGAVCVFVLDKKIKHGPEED